MPVPDLPDVVLWSIPAFIVLTLLEARSWPERVRAVFAAPGWHQPRSTERASS